MADLILHHYPQSPVSEKVRVALGIKGVAWRSVQIPRLPPKPDVVALTGGYRRTPVMQFGADIYCDSKCILAELERRCKQPSLFPDGVRGRAWLIGQWTDNLLFSLVVSLVLGSEVDKMPPEFIADRGRLYFGPQHDLRAMAKRLPDLESQLRPQLAWLQDLVQSGGFMHGSRPGLADVFVYHMVWLLRGRYPRGPALIAQFAGLEKWEQRIRQIGHGRSEDCTSEQAIEVAAAAASVTQPFVEPGDSTWLKVGSRVAIAPDGEGGDPAVHGELVRLAESQIAIRRTDARAGEVVVHFPRVGYRIDPL